MSYPPPGSSGPQGHPQRPDGFQQPVAFNQQGFQGPPPANWQYQGGQFPQPPKPRSQTWLWIIVGVLAVVVVGGLSWLFIGSNSQFIGKQVPQLGQSFAGWNEKPSSPSSGVAFGTEYGNGGESVFALRMEFTEEERSKIDPDQPYSSTVNSDVEPRKIGTGMYCLTDEFMGAVTTTCTGVWESGMVTFYGESESAAESALRDFVKSTS